MMKKNLTLAYEIVNKRFNNNDTNYGLYVLGCYGLLSKFGDAYLPLVKKLFSECEFYIDNKPILELEAEANSEYDNEIEDPTKIASSCNGHGFIVEDGKIKYEKIPLKIFVSTYDGNNNDILNSFIHEGAHIIKGSVNAVRECENKERLVIRSGISTQEFFLKDNEVYEYACNVIIDEVVNVFQTTDMMIKIKDLDPSLLDGEVLKFFNTLKYSTMHEHLGYESYIPLTEMLWKNENFKTLIECNIVTENVDNVASGFDEITKENDSFSIMADCLEQLCYTEDDETYDILCSQVRSIIESYNEESYFGDKTNKKIKS